MTEKRRSHQRIYFNNKRFFKKNIGVFQTKQTHKYVEQTGGCQKGGGLGDWMGR